MRVREVNGTCAPGGSGARRPAVWRGRHLGGSSEVVGVVRTGAERFVLVTRHDHVLCQRLRTLRENLEKTTQTGEQVSRWAEQRRSLRQSCPSKQIFLLLLVFF